MIGERALERASERALERAGERALERAGEFASAARARHRVHSLKAVAGVLLAHLSELSQCTMQYYLLVVVSVCQIAVHPVC